MSKNDLFSTSVGALIERFRAVLPLCKHYEGQDPATVIIDDAIAGCVTVADLMRCSALVAAWDQMEIAILLWLPPEADEWTS